MRTSRRRDLTTPSLNATFLVCLFLISGLRAGQSTHDHAVPEKLGVVSFSTSCKPRVQKDFERSVSLRHFIRLFCRGGFVQTGVGEGPKLHDRPLGIFGRARLAK